MTLELVIWVLAALSGFAGLWADKRGNIKAATFFFKAGICFLAAISTRIAVKCRIQVKQPEPAKPHEQKNRPHRNNHQRYAAPGQLRRGHKAVH